MREMREEKRTWAEILERTSKKQGKFKDFSKIWHFIRRLISIEYSNGRQAIFT